jgi:hypothetical protein
MLYPGKYQDLKPVSTVFCRRNIYSLGNKYKEKADTEGAVANSYNRKKNIPAERESLAEFVLLIKVSGVYFYNSCKMQWLSRQH